MDQNGPLQAKMDKMVHFGLANAKIQFGIRSFGPKWSFGPFLDHFGPAHFPTVLRQLPIQVAAAIFAAPLKARNLLRPQES